MLYLLLEVKYGIRGAPACAQVLQEQISKSGRMGEVKSDFYRGCIMLGLNFKTKM